MYNHRGWSYSSSLKSSTTMSAYRRRRLRLPRLPNPGPLPFAILIVVGVAWYHFGFAGFSVRGSVVDNATGQPLAGARVWSSRATTQTQLDGTFEIGSIKPPEMLG